ncbi:MAG: UMP kinase [Coxiellaceae bacterium]|jgi:uridylate kinase|nr:UMP kinase [Coxiellaceae bacterium]
MIMVVTKKYRYQRIVLKLSGGALSSHDYNCDINCQIIKEIACEIKVLIKNKIQVGVVVGGGNFFRGAKLAKTISRITGDHLGMIATALNALAIYDIFMQLKIPTKIMSAISIEGLLEHYNCYLANEYLNKGYVIIFAGGTGIPFVTTDTALCVRGIELNADLLLKATDVKGVYDSDPKKYPHAKFYSRLSYEEVLKKKISVMDSFAFSLGSNYQMKICVFDLHKKGALLHIMQGLDEGTLIE